jgi:uncharacterized protein (TIGR00255 family)
MAFQSMTGFSQIKSSEDQYDIEIELRSVNGKGLDIRFRLPQDYSFLEQALRKMLSEKIQRGSIQASINLVAGAEESKPFIDQAILQNYVHKASDIAKAHDLEAPRVEALMALPGVIQFNTEGLAGDEIACKAIEANIKQCFEKAIDALVQSRASEGRGLIALFKKQITRMDELVIAASKDDSLQADVMHERLQKQLALLDGDGSSDKNLDGDRLYQEVAILINRADVKEELDRLKAHIKAIQGLLSKSDEAAIGKKLDFLAQELNREANTLCSKSISPSLSAIGVDLKTTIDQFREQVQNLQ